MDALINNNLLHIYRGIDDLFQQAAKDFAEYASAAVSNTGSFTVALSGGNTVKLFFDALTAKSALMENIPWQQIKFFFGDERYVPSDDPASNYHTAKEYLFSKLPIPAENIYRVPTELTNPEMTAKDYENTLRSVFKLGMDQFPRFDLIYLGLGDDAHTASLMPFSDVVKVYSDSNYHDHKLVAASWVEKLNMYRITLTPEAIIHSTNICFLVTGNGKTSAVWQTLEGNFNPVQFPAQLISSRDRRIIWYLDQAAAEKLTLDDDNR